MRVDLLRVAAGLALEAGRFEFRGGVGDGRRRTAVEQCVGAQVPGHPDGVVADDVVRLVLLVVGGGRLGAGGVGGDDEVGEQPAGGGVGVGELADHRLGPGDHLVPVVRGVVGGEGAQVVDHEVGRAGVVGRAVVLRLEVAVGGHVVGVEVGEPGLGVGGVAAPLLVGQDQAVADVQVAVGGAVRGAAAVVRAGLAVELPLHQAVLVPVVLDQLPQAVELGLRVGVVTGHQRNDVHPVALALGDRAVVGGVAVALGGDVVLVRGAAVDQVVGLPGVVLLLHRGVPDRLRGGGEHADPVGGVGGEGTGGAGGGRGARSGHGQTEGRGRQRRTGGGQPAEAMCHQRSLRGGKLGKFLNQ